MMVDGTDPRETAEAPVRHRSPAARMDSDIEVGWILRAVARRWWVLALMIVLGAALGAAFTGATAPVHEASTTLAVSGPPAPAGSSTAAAIRTLITTPAVLQAAARRADAAGTPGAALRPDAVFVDPLPNTALLRLRVRDADAGRAGRLTEALAERAAVLSRQLQRPAEEAPEMPHRLAGALERASSRLQETEERLLTFRQRAQLELLRTDVEALLEQRKTALTLPLEIESERARLEAALEELRRTGSEGKAGGSPAAGADWVAGALAQEAAESRIRLAALERSRQLLEGVAASGETKLLQELYRREAELAGLERDHETASRHYVDVFTQVERGEVPLAVPLVRAIEKTVPAGTLVPDERLRRMALWIVIAALAGVALIVVAEATRRC